MDGFLIHPRVGLPRTLGWMSEELLHFYDIAIEEAARRGMQLFLYDEGMYPSGSCAGQVEAESRPTVAAAWRRLNWQPAKNLRWRTAKPSSPPSSADSTTPTTGWADGICQWRCVGFGGVLSDSFVGG